MKPGDKDRYRCYSCDEVIIAVKSDEGTAPTFIDCAMTICEGLMHREHNQVACMGKNPTHELYLKPEALSDKLSVREKEVTDAES